MDLAIARLRVPFRSEWLLSDGQRSWAATVPGCVHTDLLAAGVIQPAHIPDEDTKQKWISETTWTYETRFDAPSGFESFEHRELVFEGLDTVATVSLNGSELLQAENMFRTWRVSMAGHLNARDNHLVVRFHAIGPYINARANHPVVRDGVEANRLVTDRCWLRKMTLSWGWDFSVKTLTSGIWRPVWIDCWNRSRIDSILIQQHHVEDLVELTVDCRITGDQGVRVRGRVEFNGASVAQLEDKKVRVTKPRLWWPNGLGDQPLYDLIVELIDERGRIIDRTQRRIGLRTVRLVETADIWGQSFEFECNGVRFFAKGSNWVPADTLPSQVTRDTYCRRLESAAAVHQNMIRICGVGIYEAQEFYDLCDELGILVWQDFMLGNALYPGFSEEFCRNVAAEVSDQVKRIGHHACIAIWCGNNEIEHCFVGEKWGPEKRTWTDKVQSWEDYDRIFNDAIPTELRALDSVRPYVSASPHDPIDRRRWPGDRWGDDHYWEAWFWAVPFIDQRVSMHRFVSEFGCQSMPTPGTLRMMGLDPAQPYSRDAVAYFQRCGRGMEMLESYVERELGPLGSTLAEVAWQTQIAHTLQLKYAIEHWRASFGRSRGALYWQLNDCWPGITWATIDYNGAWKIPHHALRRLYSPVILIAEENRGAATARIIAANDTRAKIEAEFRWKLYRTSGQILEAGRAEHATLAPGSCHDFGTVAATIHARREGSANIFLHISLWSEAHCISEDCVFFVPPKEIATLAAEVGIESSVEDEEETLLVSTNKPVFWASLMPDEASVQLSQNGFHLLPDEPRKIIVQRKGSGNSGTIAFHALGMVAGMRYLKGKDGGIKLDVLSLRI